MNSFATLSDFELTILFQITLAIKQKSPEVLNFKRRKVCKLAEVPVHELVSKDPISKTETPSKSVLLASVSPSLFITLGAASASVILLVVLVAALYIRRVRKRDSQMGGGGASLRSSLQLNGEEEDYMEKTTAHTVVSSSDSYDTLASFTNVPVGRAEAPAWASHYTTPSLQTEYACPLPKQDWRTGDSRTSLGPAASPLVSRHPPPHPPSIHSSALATTPSRFYSSDRARGQARVRPVYSREGEGGGSYRQYQYTSAQPGDASPYSVSSELYKHVLPQYFQFSRPTSRGSVLV